VNDIKTTNVLLAVDDDASTAHIATAGDHNDIAGVEFDKVDDFGLFKVVLDGVVYFDERVGVADGAAIVGDDMGDAFGADGDFADLEELVGSFFWGDAVNCEAAFYVVEETEVFSGFLDGDDVHETSRVSFVSSNFGIDFDEALLDDGGDFTTGQSILQPVAEEDGEREGFAQFVRTWGRTRSISSGEFVEHP